MEVILKKTKITSSILKQTTNATENNLKDANFRVLGWCRYVVNKHTYKYILLYNENKQELVRYLFFSEIKEVYVNDYKGRDYYSPEKFNIEVKTPNFMDKVYTFKTQKERDDFAHDLRVIKNRAEEAGQIYL